MKDFRGRVAVVTGAASGLGREFANTAAGLGMKLVLADVQVEPLKRACAELEGQGAEVLAMVCDVRSGRLVQELADAAMARFHGVHLVFHHAGVGAGGLAWETTEADWECGLGVNLWGVIHGIRVFTRLMLACAARDPGYEGHIVNTVSMAGLLNAPAMGVYNVSQHALASLTETLYHDLQLVGAPIGVSMVCPYVVPGAPGHPQRHRPEDAHHEALSTAGQMAAQALLESAVASEEVPAAELARLTFDAIRSGAFYVHAHPQSLAAVAERLDALVHRKPPPDPYRASPQIRDLLRSKL